MRRVSRYSGPLRRPTEILRSGLKNGYAQDDTQYSQSPARALDMSSAMG
jgi:hypothetical protein